MRVPNLGGGYAPMSAHGLAGLSTSPPFLPRCPNLGAEACMDCTEASPLRDLWMLPKAVEDCKSYEAVSKPALAILTEGPCYSC